MSIDEIINILYEHMEFNNLINNEQVEEIIKQFPECIYYGQVYRCIYIVDKVIENDLWQSWSKSIDSACMTASNLRAGCTSKGINKVILTQEVENGLDLIKLLDTIKRFDLTEKQKKIVYRLLSNYRMEREVLYKLMDTYKIIE